MCSISNYFDIIGEEREDFAMKLIIKQRFLSVLDSYNIFDENDHVIYTVKGRLSFGHKLEVYDAADCHIATIREEVFTFLPRFKIYVDDHYIGSFCKKMSLFRPKYILDFNDWDIEGDVFGWNYSICSRQGVIASIHKEVLHVMDYYVIDVKNPQNALYAMLIVLSIDAEKCTAQANNN